MNSKIAVDTAVIWTKLLNEVWNTRDRKISREWIGRIEVRQVKYWNRKFRGRIKNILWVSWLGRGSANKILNSVSTQLLWWGLAWSIYELHRGTKSSEKRTPVSPTEERTGNYPLCYGRRISVRKISKVNKWDTIEL